MRNTFSNSYTNYARYVNNHFFLKQILYSMKNMLKLSQMKNIEMTYLTNDENEM